MLSDEELVTAWQAGEVHAGDELFNRHFDALFRFFRNKTAGAVDDLIQRTFLACVESRAAFRGESTFRTYLFAVARRELYAHYRSRQREPSGDVGLSSIHELGASPSKVVADAHDVRVLLQALRRIPLDHQVILELYYWEQLTAPELAKILEVPEGTVRSRLRYAKAALRTKMLDLGEDEQDVDSTLNDFDRWASAVRGLGSPKK